VEDRHVQTLNEEQQAAVDSDAPRRLVCAGPGSGKTRVLVAAVEREARQHGAAGCVVISYTNAAADELHSRLESLGVQNLGYTGTLHGFLLRCLQEWSATPVNVIDDEQRQALVEGIMKDMGVKAPLKYVMGLLDEPVRNTNLDKYECVALEYHLRLKAAGIVDFAGILAQGTEACCAMKAAGRWHYAALFVDELQDAAQPDWCFYGISELFKRKFLVGDADQAIYSFRGGKVDMFVKLAELAGNPKAAGPQYELHVLDVNCRSGTAITGPANKLISHNMNRVEKDMVAMAAGGYGEYHACGSAAEELSWVSDRMWQLAQQSLYEPKDFAILARTNHLARQFAQHLKAVGVQVAEVEQPQRPLDWRRAKLLLSVLANPWCDTLALSYLVAEGADAEKAASDAAERMCSVSEATGWRFGKGDGHVDDLHKFDLSTESRQLVHDAARELSRRGPWTLNDLVVYLGQQDGAARVVGEGVTCCTVHAAKGREWPVVFVVGCEENGFPTSAAREGPEFMEEERRLMFVAMTRAKERLVMTWCRERPEWRGVNLPVGKVTARERSRFLTEAGL